MSLLDPEPEPKPDGAPDTWKAVRGTWTLKLAAPRQGWVEAPLMVDDKPETPLSAGASRSVALPVFVPLGPDRRPLPNITLHAAVTRDPLLEVAVEKVQQGEEIDPRELEGRTTLLVPDTFLAFRSYDPEHAVALLVTKHEYEPVAEVVVSHMHLNTTVPAVGRAKTEAFLVVRNNDRQYLDLRLPKDANLRAVYVDGKAESPRRGEDGTVRVPLLGNLRKDQAFLVAFAYDHEVERSGAFFERVTLVSPEAFPVESDLLTWRVFVPKEREYTGFGGEVVRVDAGRSWALSLLRDLTSLMKRAPQGQPLDLGRMIDDLERGSPLKVQGDGQAFLFSNRSGKGSVSITSAPTTGFLLLKLALVVGGFLGARVLVRVARRLGYGVLHAFLVPALALLLLLVPAGPGWAALLTAVLVGVLLSGAASFLAWVGRRREAGPSQPATPPPAPAAGGAQ